MRYTIEGAGDHWIASDGKEAVEGTGPDEALYSLLLGTLEQETGGDFGDGAAQPLRERIASDVEVACVRLIKLVALGAPDAVLVREVEAIRKHVEKLAGA